MMKKYQLSPLLLLAVIGLSTAAQPLTKKNLIVVQDKGGTDAHVYYEALGLVAEPIIPANNSLQAPSLGTVTDNEMLPVESKLLSPGMVSTRTIHAPRLTPLFLVGDDDFSKRWLVDNQQSLQQLQAIGLIVNIKTPQALKKLRALAPTLTMYPIAGDDIAMRLGLQHYPVLITASTIAQ